MRQSDSIINVEVNHLEGACLLLLSRAASDTKQTKMERVCTRLFDGRVRVEIILSFVQNQRWTWTWQSEPVSFRDACSIVELGTFDEA